MRERERERDLTFGTALVSCLTQSGGQGIAVESWDSPWLCSQLYYFLGKTPLVKGSVWEKYETRTFAIYM